LFGTLQELVGGGEVIRTNLPNGWERLINKPPEATKRYYDAVLSVPLVWHQRVRLAAAVPRLLVVRRPGSLHQVAEWLPKVFTVDMCEVEDVELIQDYYAQSKVGVITSLVDGEQAVLEYQLCGLPVVTTSCLDNRTEWVDPKYLRVVPDKPDAVAAAVQDFIRLKYDPKRVQEAFLRRWDRWIKDPWCDRISDSLPIPESSRYRPRRIAKTGCGVLEGGYAASRAMPTVGRVG
jgi:glycosyltransferase involved in cell wall biosynthesis